MTEVQKELISQIPSVDTIKSLSSITKLYEKYSSILLTNIIRDILKNIKKDIVEDKLSSSNLNRSISESTILKEIKLRLKKITTPYYTSVINATGIIIHTNLGRSPVTKAFWENISKKLMEYSNLEYDIDSGKRSHRDYPISKRLTELFVCEAATIVNNNAGAVFLALNTFAQDKNVIISRGELIEIGGSFRIPAIMEKSNATLKEIGTTNRTHLHDFKDNIDDETSLILSVHPSNYKISGFTNSVELEELVKLGKQHNIPVMRDLGSGLVNKIDKETLLSEPTISETLKTGVDIVTFSGDKLLGGPQCGIILGKEKYVKQIRKNSLYRVLRPDKMTLYLLEELLINYITSHNSSKEIKTLELINRSFKEINNNANHVLNRVKKEIFNSEYEIKLIDTLSKVGGGSLPEETLPSRAIGIKHNTISSSKLHHFLRINGIIGRVENDWFLLDFRTIFESQLDTIIENIKLMTMEITEKY